ncbi:hypothetical protein MYAM1_002519 [Malassezia yamatoensis]|uniref:DNA polymerase delta subunit 3 n=1 Tax=Malassezia yamatoensis TaxID=253288 RepID=A0AAJ5Z042_9BASI|nr:hypothetical protein MYAM1_002519 [Malassezia yamatoensis]
MQNWLDGQKDSQVHATFVVRGMRKSANDTQCTETISVVSADSLKSIAAQYTSSEQVLYAVHMSAQFDAPLLAAVNQETLYDAEMLAQSSKDPNRLGIILNNHTISGEMPVVQVPRKAVPAAAKQDETVRPDIDSPDTKQEQHSKSPTQSKRKRRLVTRKVKTKNDKGYTVTRDVEEYESYSETEAENHGNQNNANTAEAQGARSTSDPTTDTKPSQAGQPMPPKRPAPKAKGKPGQQPSLTSFFTKR